MLGVACLSAVQYEQRQARSAYQALSVTQQCSAIQDVPVPSRITGELRIARPHRDVQAVQGVIQRLESSDLQQSILCMTLLTRSYVLHACHVLTWCQCATSGLGQMQANRYQLHSKMHLQEQYAADMEQSMYAHPSELPAIFTSCVQSHITRT